MCSPYGANLPKFFFKKNLAVTGFRFSRSTFCGLRENPLDLVSASAALLLHHAGCEKLIRRTRGGRKLRADRPGLALIRSSYGKSPVSRLIHRLTSSASVTYVTHGFYGRSGSWSHILIFALPGMDSIHCGCDRGLRSAGILSCFYSTPIGACMSFVLNHIVLLPEATAN